MSTGDLADIEAATKSIEPCISESIDLALDLLNAETDQMSDEDHQRAIVGILQRLRTAAKEVDYIRSRGLLRDLVEKRDRAKRGEVQP